MFSVGSYFVIFLRGGRILRLRLPFGTSSGPGGILFMAATKVSRLGRRKDDIIYEYLIYCEHCICVPHSFDVCRLLKAGADPKYEGDNATIIYRPRYASLADAMLVSQTARQLLLDMSVEGKVRREHYAVIMLQEHTRVMNTAFN